MLNLQWKASLLGLDINVVKHCQMMWIKCVNLIVDMDCPVAKFCVSMMAGKLCQIGIQTHTAAWNSHRIPGTLYVM